MKSWFRSTGIALLLPLLACLAAAPALAVTKVRLSFASGHPGITVRVSGSGFTANEAVDVYFDTTDMLLVFTDGAGSFSKRDLIVPADALPGAHWITATGRKNGDSGQSKFMVSTAWAEYGFTERGQRNNPYENVIATSNVNTLGIAWTETPSDQIYSCPTVANGFVYVASLYGTVYALSATSGATVWSVPVAGTTSTAAVSNGVVYVTSGGTLYAFNATTGATLWTASVASSASPTVANGVVYLGSYSGVLYALDAKTGTTLWTATAGIAAQTAAVANGMVYISTGDGIQAFNAANGAALWTVAGAFSAPAVANGMVYAGGQDHQLYAYTAASGKLLWATPTGSNVESPAVADGIVYAVTDDAVLHAFNAANGFQLWITIGIAIYHGSVPAVANGVVYVGGYGGGEGNANIYAFSKTGVMLWMENLGVNSEGVYIYSPSVADGMMYVAAGLDGGPVYAFALGGRHTASRDGGSLPPSYASLHPNRGLKVLKLMAHFGLETIRRQAHAGGGL